MIPHPGMVISILLILGFALGTLVTSIAFTPARTNARAASMFMGSAVLALGIIELGLWTLIT